jgi:hypothetical protein
MCGVKSFWSSAALALVLLAGAAVQCIFPFRVWAQDKVLQGEQGKQRMEAIRGEIANVRSNVFLTLLELDRVRGERGPERPHFQTFSAQLGHMQEVAKAFAQRAEDMKRKGDAYFEDWESQLRAEKKPDPRYAERKQSFDLINVFMQKARTNFLDYTAILTEIKTLLQHDPSAADVAKAKDLFGTANWRCIDVQRALAYMEIEFDRLADSFGKDADAKPAEAGRG